LGRPTPGVSATEASQTKPELSESGSTPKVQKKKQGRPEGSGSWAAADAPLIDKMHELIEARRAKSPTDAAHQVAGEAQGKGAPESKITRLRKRYSEKYSSERKSPLELK
jgi:hypothetical protein